MRQLILETVVLCAITVCFILLLSPRMNSIRVHEKDRISTPPYFPIEIAAQDDPLVIDFVLETSPFQDKIFMATVDDCVKEMFVNNVKIEYEDCTWAGFRHAAIINLTEHLTHKKNEIRMVVLDTRKNVMGLVDFALLQGGMKSLALSGSVLLLLLLIGVRVTGRFTNDKFILGIVLIGIFVRWNYVDKTPYFIRANDMDVYQGHADYIRYLVTHWKLPPPSGWEYHQMPLFYLLAAPILFVTLASGLTISMMALQWMTLAISSGTVLIHAWIGCKLFDKKGEEVIKRVFVALCVFQGVFTMFSSQLSNDVLLLFFLSLGCARLMVWEETGAKRDWYICLLLSILSVLTKASGIILFVICIGFLLLRTSYAWREKMSLCMRSIIWFLIGTAWLPIIVFSNTPKAVENFLKVGEYNLQNFTKYERVLADYVTFNPLEVLKNTNVNAPFSIRNIHTLEYLFQTSVFGEHQRFFYQKYMFIVLSSAMPLLLFILAGMYYWFEKRSALSIPIVTIGCVAMTSMYLYVLRTQHPFHQNFRLVSIAGITAAYFIALALNNVRGPVRLIGVSAVIVHVALMSTFLLAQ